MLNPFGDLFVAIVIAFGILLGISLLIWWMIRGLVLWYFRINEIVNLLEQIERNTRSGHKEANGLGNDEEELYSRNNVRVTNKRLIIPPNEWQLEQFLPVQVEIVKGKYRVNLIDKTGYQVHYLESESKERIDLIAATINKVLAAMNTMPSTKQGEEL